MATTEIVDQFRPTDFLASGNGLLGTTPLVAVGRSFGVPLPKLDTVLYTFHVRVPLLGTPLTTGLTLQIATVDDPNNSHAGKVYRLGVQSKLIASTTDNLTATGAATEQTTDITGDATSGEVTLTALAITTANLDTPVAGSMLEITVRRIGSHANDTHSGRVVLLGIVVSDT